MKFRQIVTFALVLLATACGKDTTNNGSDAGNVSTSDGGTTTDGGTPDGGTTPGDAGATTDTGTPDAAGSADASTGDMSGSTDTGNADGGPGMDAGDNGGCAAGFTETVGVADTIVACAGAADTLNQCDAGDACAAGWHVCTASEYRTHYEATEPPAVADANFWLASCIRDGADPTAPSDQVCSDCTGTQTGGTADVAFSCVNAITIDSQQLYVGVRAGSACVFVGLDEAGNDAYWNAQPSSTLQAGAFCCAD